MRKGHNQYRKRWCIKDGCKYIHIRISETIWDWWNICPWNHLLGASIASYWTTTALGLSKNSICMLFWYIIYIYIYIYIKFHPIWKTVFCTIIVHLHVSAFNAFGSDRYQYTICCYQKVEMYRNPGSCRINHLLCYCRSTKSSVGGRISFAIFIIIISTDAINIVHKVLS